MPICPICFENHYIRVNEKGLVIDSCIGEMPMHDFDALCCRNGLPVRQEKIKLEKFLREVEKRL